MRKLPGIEDKFFKLLQIAVGKTTGNDIVLSEKEWGVVYQLAAEQSLLGVVLTAVDSHAKNGNKPPMSLLLQWIGEVEIIKQQNKRIDKQCEQLTAWFSGKGFKSCILKGQGVARLYREPESRQPGDIDIWVDAPRDTIVKLLRDNFIGVTCVDYVNCHVAFFSDTEVETHFRPTYMFNPFTNRKVQKWIARNKDIQMNNINRSLIFRYPTIGFNLVFSLIHIYRHVFLEGIGLRQLMDYYYIILNSSDDERKEAFATLRSFGIGKFVGAVMYIMHKVFGIESSYLLCEINEREGQFLLEEILRGGNFGHYDDRNTFIPDEQRIKKALNNSKRNNRYLSHYPSEVIWMPFFKIWHWCWRKWKGYL